MGSALPTVVLPDVRLRSRHLRGCGKGNVRITHFCLHVFFNSADCPHCTRRMLNARSLRGFLRAMFAIANRCSRFFTPLFRFDMPIHWHFDALASKTFAVCRGWLVMPPSNTFLAESG